MNWVENVKNSIPDHSKDIRLNLDAVINRNGKLDEVDTHACALAAAIAANNGELAFAIQMLGPLQKHTAEVEAAKSAASLMGMNNVYYPFLEMVNDPELSGLPPGLRMNVYSNHGGVSKKKFEMYALAASIVGKCSHCIKSHYNDLKKEGMTVDQLQVVAKISAIITAIGKVAPDVDSLLTGFTPSG